MTTPPPKVKPKRTQPKLTAGVKVTLTALGVLSFLGGWDLIARQEQQKEAQASEPVATPLTPKAAPATPTAWSTISPLPEFPPIPTLTPTLVIKPAATLLQPTGNESAGQDTHILLAPIALLPTLAPLPNLPPPPPPPPSNGGNRSGGS